MSAEQLLGWTPVRVYWHQSRLFVDWALLGKERLTEPFFEQTIGHVMHHPFNLLFKHQTPIEALSELREISPGLPPSGFIFHMSRCGSTLISQMLAALARNIVISEAPPIDSVLRARDYNREVTEEQRLEWFRALVSALGQPLHESESRLFIKFDSWHTLDLPLIRRAFPDVPWIFVYREPIEVLVSHERNRGSQLLPGTVPTELLGLDLSEVGRMSLEEYGARALAAFCEAALRYYETGGGLLVNYRELPEAVFTSLLSFFRVSYSADEIERMREASRFDAKSPQMFFRDDTESKRREATEELRQLSERWLETPYKKLEAIRQA